MASDMRASERWLPAQSDTTHAAEALPLPGSMMMRQA
jgi:hypothetical protein